MQLLVGRKSVNSELVHKLVENRLNLDINYKQLKSEIVDYLHLNGIKVNCWTCDKKEDAEKLIDIGVDFITTNILE